MDLGLWVRLPAAHAAQPASPARVRASSARPASRRTAAAASSSRPVGSTSDLRRCRRAIPRAACGRRPAGRGRRRRRTSRSARTRHRGRGNRTARRRQLDGPLRIGRRRLEVTGVEVERRSGPRTGGRRCSRTARPRPGAGGRPSSHRSCAAPSTRRARGQLSTAGVSTASHPSSRRSARSSTGPLAEARRPGPAGEAVGQPRRAGMASGEGEAAAGDGADRAGLAGIDGVEQRHQPGPRPPGRIAVEPANSAPPARPGPPPCSGAPRSTRSAGPRPAPSARAGGRWPARPRRTSSPRTAPARSWASVDSAAARTGPRSRPPPRSRRPRPRPRPARPRRLRRADRQAARRRCRRGRWGTRPGGRGQPQLTGAADERGGETNACRSCSSSTARCAFCTAISKDCRRPAAGRARR